MSRPSSLSLSVAMALALVAVGCSEKPQTATTATKKSDVAAFHGTDNGHAVSGFKAGDKDAWLRHLNQRAQGQNEHVRVGGPKSG